MALNNTFRATLERPDLLALSKTLDARALPPGPGNNWGDPAFRQSHHKAQTLSGEFAGKMKNYSVPTRAPVAKPEVATKSAMDLTHSLEYAEEGRSAELNKQRNATLEDKICRFYGYFKEGVKESPMESHRIRRISIVYFPVDDSLMIQERKVANSGLPGGTLLKRQKVAANARQRAIHPQYEHVNLNHFNVGVSVTLNGVEYHIVDCDSFTHQFLTELGIEVGEPTEIPDDAFSANQRRQAHIVPSSQNKEPTREMEDAIKSRRFIRDSGKVIRFYGVWDERGDSPTGILHNLEARYFVEDDTIQIHERQTAGEVVPGGFLSRRKLPKAGANTNAVELTFMGRHESNPDKFYMAHDLTIGATINVYGREVKLYNCDDYTREYYANVFGVDVGEPIPVQFGRPRMSVAKLPPPPPTGFGSDDDSLASCKTLVISPPKKRPQLASDGNLLRFRLALHNPEREEDAMRVFVLTYYCDDGEMMVQENAVKNTGFTGGKFLRKQRLRKNLDDPDEKPIYFNLDDIVIGTQIIINKFKFDIVEADMHTEHYLKYKNSNGIPPELLTTVKKERLQQLLSALHQFITCRFCTLTEAFRSFDKDKDGKISVSELTQGLRDNQITSKGEEAVAVMQQLDLNGQGYLSYQDIFKTMSNPLTVRNISQDQDGIDVQEGSVAYVQNAQLRASEVQRDKLLKKLKERLESRCLNGVEMFRMISTMPRAYKDKRADVLSLTNGAKDVLITPVQLRRSVQETLGMLLTTQEMNILLGFFFPSLPVEDYNSVVDLSFEHALDLRGFQACLNAMNAIGHLK